MDLPDGVRAGRPDAAGRCDGAGAGDPRRRGEAGPAGDPGQPRHLGGHRPGRRRRGAGRGRLRPRTIGGTWSSSPRTRSCSASPAARSGRRAGRPAGWPGSGCPPGCPRIAFGAVDPAGDAHVVTVAGSTRALPGTEPGLVKATPLLAYPGKGRATGGVRCMRFTRGADRLIFAGISPGPPIAASAAGTPVDLPAARRAQGRTGRDRLGPDRSGLVVRRADRHRQGRGDRIGAMVERMTALDATFLVIERRNRPMHVGALILMDPGPGRVRHRALVHPVARTAAPGAALSAEGPGGAGAHRQPRVGR